MAPPKMPAAPPPKPPKSCGMPPKLFELELLLEPLELLPRPVWVEGVACVVVVVLWLKPKPAKFEFNETVI